MSNLIGGIVLLRLLLQRCYKLPVLVEGSDCLNRFLCRQLPEELSGRVCHFLAGIVVQIKLSGKVFSGMQKPPVNLRFQELVEPDWSLANPGWKPV